MGIIKDGTVSGFLPTTDAFVVFYPAYPSSTSRAIETLGGVVGFVKARTLKSNKLELRFRPEDPYSHPAFGELQPCNNLLLKISKKKSYGSLTCDDNNRASEPALADLVSSGEKPCAFESVRDDPKESHLDNESVIYADIVARVSEAYHFNGMVDYQHVVDVRADATKRKRTWKDVEPNFEKGGLMDVDQDEMTLVPPLFSPKDKPVNLVLRPSSMLSSKKLQEGGVHQQPEMNSEPNYFMEFDIEEIPKKTDWEQYVPQGSAQWGWQMAVAKLFEERPIWPKASVVERLFDNGIEVGPAILKRLLFRLAYYFSNGPFLRFWIKKGYDPRKDPASRIYQRIDFRVPPPLLSYCDSNKAKNLKHKWKDLCAFRVFPHKCHTSLQFFELDDDYIQGEIRKPSKQTTCSYVTGWFSDVALENLRSRVYMKFLSVYPKTGAESQLKSASERFEKSKKMLVCKANEVGLSQVNKERDSDIDKEESQHVSEEENIGVEEEEEEDEEVDAYEAIHQDDDSNEVSLYQDLDGEDISRNYLQELFDSFPSTLPTDNKTQDAETSDGEYQIYEHNSDDSSGEDDD